MMSRTDEFLELYKKLEVIVANNYGTFKGGGSVAKLARREEFKYIRAELDYIRDVRNLLTHRPKIDGSFMVEPSGSMVELLKDIIDKVERPAVAGNVMLELSRVIYCTKEDRVMPALRRMYQKAISFIPILEDGVVSGVFGNSTFIHCSLSGEYQITDETCFREIEKELSLNGNPAEVFLFADRHTPLDKLSDMIEEVRSGERKVNMIFVTEHGKPSEKLLGIVTAWDVAAAY